MCPLWSSLFSLICFACFALLENAPREPLYLHSNALWIYTWNEMSDGTVPSAVPTELRATRRQIIRPEKDTMSATGRLLPSTDPLNAGKKLSGRCEAETNAHSHARTPRVARICLLHVAPKLCRLVLGRSVYTSGEPDVSHLGHQWHHNMSSRIKNQSRCDSVWFICVTSTSNTRFPQHSSGKVTPLLWQYWDIFRDSTTEF